MSRQQVIGMMEGAFFVPQSEIVGWLRSFYGFEISKVEEACTGAIYCQVIDSIHRGKVPLHRVNFDARFDYEWVANYKILQTAFDNLGIQKSIDVQSLIKGKRMDNLEFLQWLKRYFDLNHNSSEEYDAVKIREDARTLFYKKKALKPPPARHASSSSSSSSSSSKRTTTRTTGTKSSSTSPSTSSSRTTSSTAKTSSSGAVRRTRPQTTDKENKTKTNTTTTTTPSPNTTKLETEISSLKEEVTELTSTLQSMEKERDFYYAKLREIELLCQNTEMSPFVRSVEDIMYAE